MSRSQTGNHERGRDVDDWVDSVAERRSDPNGLGARHSSIGGASSLHALTHVPMRSAWEKNAS
jgi:hypothetical protein